MSETPRTWSNESASTSSSKEENPEAVKHFSMPGTWPRLTFRDSDNQLRSSEDAVGMHSPVDWPVTAKKLTRKDKKETNNPALDGDVFIDNVYSVPLTDAQRETNDVPAIVTENSRDLFDDDPRKTYNSQYHINTTLSRHRTQLPKAILPQFNNISSFSDSRTPSGSRTSKSSRESTSINDSTSDFPSTPDTSFIVSPTSPTDISAFEVRTPSTTPTPLPGRKKWTQQFTLKADSISRQLKAQSYDDLWSPSESEQSPVYDDRPISCRLPKSRNRSTLTEDEAFKELETVFRDIEGESGLVKGSEGIDAICTTPLDADSMGQMDVSYLADFEQGGMKRDGCGGEGEDLIEF